ncbi:retron-type reverse transcriptase [Lachnospiraceae bacterium TWA4]|nr:retron-type reverse transcriptase [Lachnospiraceae bacterium TWA4]
MGIYTKIIDLQKLEKSWQKVRQNKPAAGADGITVDEFEARKREYLQQLHLDLKNGVYKPQVVKMISIVKNEKVREIGLFSMRDKVVHLSIQLELQKIYEPIFSSRCQAYRPGKSSLLASKEIEGYVKTHTDYWLLKLDIEKFFDNISKEQLIDILNRRLHETELIDLLKCCLNTSSVDKDGVIHEKEVGVYQGSSLSPVLSNIYLSHFDKLMENKCEFYLRYSDDILILGKDEDTVKSCYKVALEEIQKMGLSFQGIES